MSKNEKIKSVLKLFEKDEFIEVIEACETDEQIITAIREYGFELNEVELVELQKALEGLLGEEGEIWENGLDAVSGGITVGSSMGLKIYGRLYYNYNKYKVKVVADLKAKIRKG